MLKYDKSIWQREDRENFKYFTYGSKELPDNTPVLYLGASIMKRKDDYYRLLNEIPSRRQWKNWIIYMLNAVEETSLYTIHKIEEIDRLFDRTLKLVEDTIPPIRKNLFI